MDFFVPIIKKGSFCGQFHERVKEFGIMLKVETDSSYGKNCNNGSHRSHMLLLLIIFLLKYETKCIVN